MPDIEGPYIVTAPLDLEAIKARLALAAGAWAVSAHRPEIDLTLQKIAQVDAPALVAEVERLRAALEFYALPENYETPNDGSSFGDEDYEDLPATN